MKVAFVGQPNCGKSTLFNQIAGYKSLSANFPGATVEYTKGQTYIDDEIVEVFDLPGTYSLSWYDDAEKETVKALFSMDFDVIVNILDASTLARSIELTIELMSLEKPMVVALNMMDEAYRKGIVINVKKLEDVLGVRVIPVIAKKGKGIKNLLNAVKNAQKPRKRCVYSKDVEKYISIVADCIEKSNLKSRWPYKMLAIKAIEGFKPCEKVIEEQTDCFDRLKQAKYALRDGLVIVQERHALCMDIFEKVAKVKKIKEKSIETRLDAFLLHPFFGYIFMVLIFYSIFYIVFTGGVPVEGFIVGVFDKVDSYLAEVLSSNRLVFSIVKGVVDGVGAAFGIAFPYLLPFLFLISLLEDIGYLPRIGFLMDSLMHKMGLHGTSVIPFVSGYGCSVPAIMATRILKSKKEKFISAFLASLVPCSARTTVIMGLVGYFLGYWYAIALYIFNIVVIFFTGMVLKRLLPGMSPEMIIDIPPYRLPTVKTLLLKTWHKIKDFIYLAVPMLIGGSVVLTLIDYYHLTPYINDLFKPFLEGFLGLPAAVGVVLIFGILKKELTLLMLYQALGVAGLNQLSSVMSKEQMLVFTVFVIFYVPCLATIAAIKKEVGLKNSLVITAATFFLASLLAFVVKIAMSIWI
ncbi:ferrous iron transport protein B [Hippea alviniae]|uniref:ferrous iron transport protein B n=1 Tax=Hippea alviniae TaxID=1279027 RepID=UPI000414CE53|nr:ferrous iron transport protein B [Hippea alviniae]